MEAERGPRAQVQCPDGSGKKVISFTLCHVAIFSLRRRCYIATARADSRHGLIQMEAELMVPMSDGKQPGIRSKVMGGNLNSILPCTVMHDFKSQQLGD